MRHLLTLALAMVLLATPALGGDLKLHALFSDNAVLQAGQVIRVWGWGKADDEITVTFDGRQSGTKVQTDGRWQAQIPARNPGGPYELTVSSGSGESITIKNVLVGEVWVASGQSNMEFGMGHITDAKKEIQDSDYPSIRLFTVKTTVAATPQENVEGEWVVSTPKTAEKFSAVGFLFARGLHKQLKQPVGLIHSSVSGTIIEAWIRPDAMKAEKKLGYVFDRYQKALAEYPAKQKAYQAELEAWEKASAAIKGTTQKAPKKPAEPRDPAKETTRPGGLYNGKIAPLMPYTIAGVIWWQGEYNSEQSEEYKTLFPMLINDWRAQWGQGQFPFLFVQLENFEIPADSAAHYDQLRDAQLFTFKTVESTAMAVSCDVGDPKNIHPPHKQPVAERLVLAARALAYRQDVVYSGPIYEAMKVADGKVEVKFQFVGGGLEARNGSTSDDLQSFEIAGEDQKFVPAKAKIAGNKVVVWSDAVKSPKAVRYAWSDTPTCSLYNKEGLPASPFRTDSWPLPVGPTSKPAK